MHKSLAYAFAEKLYLRRYNNAIILYSKENFWATVNKSLQGQIVAWGNLKEKIVDVLNMSSPEVTQNLYSSYKICLANVIQTMAVSLDISLLSRLFQDDFKILSPSDFSKTQLIRIFLLP